MPEMWFVVRWPDGSFETCYSPSLVIKDFFTPGESYPLADFVSRSQMALETASARVRKKYGYGCAHALAQLADIAQMAARFHAQPDASVTVETFEE